MFIRCCKHVESFACCHLSADRPIVCWFDRLLGVRQVKTSGFRERAMARRIRRQGKSYLGEKDSSVEQKSSLMPVCWSLCLDCCVWKHLIFLVSQIRNVNLRVTNNLALFFVQSDKRGKCRPSVECWGFNRRSDLPGNVWLFKKPSGRWQGSNVSPAQECGQVVTHQASIM